MLTSVRFLLATDDGASVSSLYAVGMEAQPLSHGQLVSALGVVLPWGVTMMGLMYLRKKNPPMNELILSDEASRNFSCKTGKTKLVR